MIGTAQTPLNVQAHLLLADAQAQARSQLAQALRQHGYLVDEADSGTVVLTLLEKNSIDLLLLDLNLAGMNGVEVMRRARQMHRDLPIIVLTAHATIESTIAAIKTNVVDYLLKPCRTDDLLLTISRAIEERAQQLRRQRLFERLREAMDTLDQPSIPVTPLPVPQPTPIADNVVQAGMLVFDREKRVVTLQTTPPRTVELTEGEASVLLALMAKPNQVFTYNQLAKTALGYEGMDKWTVESVIRSTVFRLRHKIEDGTDAPQFIRTVRGRGYFFAMV